MEYVYGILIIVVLLAMSGFFGWRQIVTLRWLKTQPQMMPEERIYYRQRSYRRLFGCVLTALLAVLFSGLYWLGILSELDRLVERGVQAREQGQQLQLTEEEDDFVRFCYSYVGAIALVIFVLLGVAFVDTLATRRYGMRQRKRIRDDRQAMLQRQLPLLRRSRNGN